MSLRPWNHNIHYYSLVLGSAGPACRRARDVGWRRLAQHCQEVVAIDMDPDAISQARAGGDQEGRIKFIEGDVMTYPFPDDNFDLISAVATLHHL